MRIPAQNVQRAGLSTKDILRVHMGERLEEMPLFLLNTVLFPYAQLQLHIFEPKYRKLIDFCLENDGAFGVVLSRPSSDDPNENEHYMVGTAVRIISVHTFDDGNMDVQVKGERRFRVRKVDENLSFLMGQVEPVVEMEIDDDQEAENLVMMTRDYVHAYIENYFMQMGA